MTALRYNRTHGRYLVSEALRDAGFILMPDLWIRPEDMPALKALAEPYADQVNEVRAQVRQKNQELLDIRSREIQKAKEAEKLVDPKDDKEAAWAAYEKARSGS